jgi:hypothetical protein
MGFFKNKSRSLNSSRSRSVNSSRSRSVNSSRRVNSSRSLNGSRSRSAIKLNSFTPEQILNQNNSDKSAINNLNKSYKIDIRKNNKILGFLKEYNNKIKEELELLEKEYANLEGNDIPNYACQLFENNKKIKGGTHSNQHFESPTTFELINKKDNVSKDIVNVEKEIETVERNINANVLKINKYIRKILKECIHNEITDVDVTDIDVIKVREQIKNKVTIKPTNNRTKKRIFTIF